MGKTCEQRGRGCASCQLGWLPEEQEGTVQEEDEEHTTIMHHATIKYYINYILIDFPFLFLFVPTGSGSHTTHPYYTDYATTPAAPRHR